VGEESQGQSYVASWVTANFFVSWSLAFFTQAIPIASTSALSSTKLVFSQSGKYLHSFYETEM